MASHTKEDFFEGWLGYSTVDDKVYGIPGRSNIKSLVWYSPAAFKEKGYTAPTSLEELKTLSDKIVGRRRHPVVRRRRVGRGHRLGAHRLDGGLHAPSER